jgi:hypothetical protein
VPVRAGQYHPRQRVGSGMFDFAAPPPHMAESLRLSETTLPFTLRLRLSLSMQENFIAMPFMIGGHAHNLA